MGETKAIETPAGKFGAVPVTLEGKDPTATAFFWYAPAVEIVKIEGARTRTKFTPGK